LPGFCDLIPPFALLQVIATIGVDYQALSFLAFAKGGSAASDFDTSSAGHELATERMINGDDPVVDTRI
jgi:hypothetical protein